MVSVAVASGVESVSSIAVVVAVDGAVVDVASSDGRESLMTKVNEVNTR